MQLTEKQKQVLIVGLIFAVILLLGVIYIHFMLFRGAIQEAQEQMTTIEENIVALEDEIEMMEDFINDEEERNRLAARVERAKRRLPSDPQAIQFLELLEDSLRDTGVSFTRIARQQNVSRSMYEEIPYEITGQARYHEFGQFVNLIECHPERFMRVNSFQLSNNDRRPSIHPMEVGISTYMFRGQ